MNGVIVILQERVAGSQWRVKHVSAVTVTYLLTRRKRRHVLHWAVNQTAS